MAGFSDKIQVVIDVVTSGAKSSLSDVKGKVAETEGSFGKLKAGAGGVFDTLKSAGPLALAGVGTALAGFAIKGVSDFENLGVAAGNFSDAAGISTQDASRWIEVGDDLGVSTEAVQASMQRLNREAASGALAKFGITAQNSNDRLIQTLQYLHGIPDEAQRAQAQFTLLGKGGAALEPLIASAGELDGRLKSVSGNKIISPQEATNAKNLRDAMDNVTDAVDNLEIGLGENLAPAIVKVTQLAVGGDGSGGLLGALGSLGKIKDSIPGGNTIFDEVVGDLNPVGKAIDLLGELQGAVGDTTDATNKSAAATDGNSRSLTLATSRVEDHAKSVQTDKDAQEAAKEAQDAYAARVKFTADQLDTEKKALDDARTALEKKQQAGLAAIGGELAYEQSVNGVGSALHDFEDKQKAATDAVKKYGDGSPEAVAANTDVENSSLSLQTSLLQVASAADQVAKDQATATGANYTTNDSLAAQVGALEALKQKFPELSGGIDAFIAKLNAIPRTINTTVIVTGPSGVEVHGPGGTIARAGGGPVTAGQPYVVGENRPELFVPNESGTILPDVPTGGGGGGGGTLITLNVNAGWGANGTRIGEEIVKELHKYCRRNGILPKTIIGTGR